MIINTVFMVFIIMIGEVSILIMVMVMLMITLIIL